MVAYALKIPIEKISIKFTDSRTNPNGRPTGGSVASELCCQVKFNLNYHFKNLQFQKVFFNHLSL